MNFIEACADVKSKSGYRQTDNFVLWRYIIFISHTSCIYTKFHRGIRTGLTGIRTGLTDIRAGFTGIRTGLTGIRAGLTGISTGLTDIRTGLIGIRAGLTGIRAGLTGISPLQSLKPVSNSGCSLRRMSLDHFIVLCSVFSSLMKPYMNTFTYF